ncbi:MAG: molybdopterin-dependent oxidoreductase [Candidatus Dadabacteria bacterium]|nr:molybdopterin-dependent oxidoreductase [Candidatus Dadabacteria bacterium]
MSQMKKDGSTKLTTGGIKRRDFLKILGVAGGTAAVAGACSPEPVEKIIPYVIPPDTIIPGIPNWYASTCRECPAGCGILVKNREGRAIKIEGNPLSPINSGGTCARGQAALQGLYNPDRIRGPLTRNSSGGLEPTLWDEAERVLVEKIKEIREKGNANKIVFLTNNISGSLNRLIDDWLNALGGGRHIVYETFSHEPIKEANRIAFGMNKVPTYNIEKTKYLLSFGSDFLETWLSPVQYAKRFSEMHGYKDKGMGKFVQVEPRLSLTGASADEWIGIRPGTEAFLALGISNFILSNGLASVSGYEADRLKGLVQDYKPDVVSLITDIPQETITRIAKEFVELKPSLALGGGAANTSSKSTQALVAINILNYIAGNVGETVNFGDNLTLSNVNSYSEITSLVDSMSKGEVELLLIYDVNPAFTLPKALKFEDALKGVPFVVSFSSFMDETTEGANLVLPDHTTLEKWGDYIPQDSVHGLIQPIMDPIFNTKATGDVILSISKKIEGLDSQFASNTFYDYLRDSWRQIQVSYAPDKDFETFWKETVESGGIYREIPPIKAQLSQEASSVSFSEPKFEGQGDTYFMAYPSYRYYDGRGANKPWLQELPDAITTAVWDSWVEINPGTAEKMGIKDGDFISIESPYGNISTQAYIYKGIRKDTVAIPIGLGHKGYGRYAQNRGVNPIDILSPLTDQESGGFAWLSTKVSISNTGRHEQFVRTQENTTQAGRGIAQSITLKELGSGVHEEHEKNEFNMYPPQKYIAHRWGMSIDLSKCIGCGACVTACYAENNVPVVGKGQVAKRREMSWIRIERYYEEDNGFDIRFIPMLCQHCGNAPCEPVCPVYATYHNPDGLNAMVYNRCVGTRYCSNNCTYKVRRFNWFTYEWHEPLNWQLNPDVSVRTKGIMEKCTFCVQRIRFGKDRARDEGRNVRDGEITPACAQACPTKVIVFGDLKDTESTVSHLSKDERGYLVLQEVNTQPAITYLKKVTWDKA